MNNVFTKVLLLASVASALASTLEEQQNRRSKSLVNVFPFRNGAQRSHGDHGHHAHGDHAHHAHDDHHDHGHHAPALSLPTQDFSGRASRQGAGEEVALDIASIASAGERCVEKVVMEEHTAYDDHITCKHSYSLKCHTTYTTDYEPQQEEECEETFTKSCFIEYKTVASEEQVQFCHTPLACEGEGPEEEKTVYESVCETHYHAHEVEDDVVECETIQESKCEDVTQGYTTEEKCHTWPVQKCTPVSKETVIKHTPITECHKHPRTITVKGACIPEPQPEECFDKTETIVQEVPQETCTLEPQKTCKFVTKLVPLLKPAEECVDIPKEVCSRQRIPRKEKELKPVVKKWCYVPSEESGLA